MVTMSDKTDTAHLFELLSSVVDPEIPVLTLQDLGVLRDISVDGGEVTSDHHTHLCRLPGHGNHAG